eukprot:TRINITY_DN111993_c0_g1_i1.p1 TRINITY_DN111993_c0_g1~~TRINITY_DN111993_c0_g1_i1.p1  ORF type:complete len:447 (+),score=57.33 TRINITY_DN111993_c0_g1_i1:149-1489(+)
MSDLVGSKAASRTFRKLCSKDSRSFNNVLGVHNGIQLLIVSHTILYRYLAKTRVSEDDRFVEIGCSYGDCTSLAGCPALGVDHAKEKIHDAQESYPACRFVVGDVFGDDLSFLDMDATVLFLDIGGGRNYKPVMKALAICLPVLPKLRLIVAKSIEVSSFLLKFKNAAYTVACDLVAVKDDDAEIAEELAIEIRRRGGELPLSLIYSHLHCGPRLRYLVGKQRMSAFLKGQSPLLQVVEADSGPPEHRARIRVAPGCVPPPPTGALMAVQADFRAHLRKQLQDGDEWSLIAVFGRIPAKLRRRFVSLAADPDLHGQCSDASLDDRCVEAWSHAWQSAVELRHFHAFALSSPEFVLTGDSLNDVATMEELGRCRIRWTRENHDPIACPDEVLPVVAQGKQVMLQVLDCNWLSDAEDRPEIKDLSVERAWLLADGTVAEQLIEATDRS